MERAVFLDRDGTINELVYNVDEDVLDSPFTARRFRLMPRVAEAIKRVNRIGYLTVVVSNQPAIAKKKMTAKAFGEINKKMVAELKRKGAALDGVYYCLHHPKSKIKKYKKKCSCRKPKPGLLRMAARGLNINLRKSYMIGDSWMDVVAGKKAGCITILIGNKEKCDMCKLLIEKDAKPNYIVNNLYEAVKKIK